MFFSNVGNAAVIHVNLTPHAARKEGALAWLDAKELSRWQ